MRQLLIALAHGWLRDTKALGRGRHGVALHERPKGLYLLGTNPHALLRH